MSSNQNTNDSAASTVATTSSQQQQNVCQIEEQIIYTTDDGFDIPPEIETSCLMALEVERLIMLENAKKEQEQQQQKDKKHENDNNDDDEKESETTTSRQVSSPEEVLAVADFSTLFKEYDEGCQREKEFQAQQQEENEQQDQEGDDDDEEEEEYSMEGMIHSTSALGMEREETDQSQWKLEEILHRKSVAVQYDDIDAEVEDDDPRAVGHSATSKIRTKKEFSYLCKWAPGGRCTTWELRSLLVEEGFGPEVEAYDLYVKQKGFHEKKERVDPYKDPCEYGKIAARTPHEKLPATKKRTAKPLHLNDVPPHRQFFENLFPNWKKDLSRKFASSSIRINRVCRIAPEQAATCFIDHMKQLGATDDKNSKERNSIGITFHGTSVAGVVGIMNNGLIVPGSLGVRIANANVFGLKIYTATEPATSVHYDRTMMKLMFACVGMATDDHTHGNYICFAEERKVCPVWLIQYSAVGSSRYLASHYEDDVRWPVMDNFKDFIRAVSADSAAPLPPLFGVSSERPDTLPTGLMTAHDKKILRQRRQKLGLQKISF